MPTISLHGVTKAYRDRERGHVPALDGLDLVLPGAAVTVLTGPAGCGTTAVLRVIAGLDPIDAGQVRFDDTDMTAVPTHERDIALVTAESPLYPGLTVRAQLAEALQFRTPDRADAGERVLAEARALGLEPVLDRSPHQLAAGARQRLALGRALVRSPSVVLLDDPLNALDAGERARLRADLTRLWGHLGATVVYVTRDMTEAMAIADQIAFLDAGRLVQMDTPEVCYHRPATAVVASLVGGRISRLIDAEVRPEGLRIGAVDMPLGAGQQRAIGNRHRVLVDVRATNVRAGPDAGPSDGVPIAVTVERIGGAGPVWDLEVALEPGGPSAPRLLAQVPPATPLRPGDAMIVRLDVGACSMFDVDDGRALHHGRVHGPA